MHPRACLSAISTFKLSLPADLAFWSEHGITNVGVSVAKLEAFGWDVGTEAVVAAVGNGLQVVDLIGLGPFHLADSGRWDHQRDRLVRSIETAAAVGADRIVFTTGPFAPLTWEEAADALEQALAPVLHEARAHNVEFAIEHTNSLRVDVGFVHTLRDAIDLARRLDTGVCMEMNACWAERALAQTIRSGIDRIHLVQVSDFKVGTVASSQRLVPGDGDIPMLRIMRALVDAGYEGVFELELIGDAIAAEGSTRYSDSSRSRPSNGGPHARVAERGRVRITRPSISATRSK
jgi:sugar phosphate isomerase/epimerase